MTKERKAWIPTFPELDESDVQKKFEESLESGYESIRRSREKTAEIRKEYKAKALAVG